MSKPLDMALFLSGVLTGSNATQQRHLRQARVMQAAIQQRWQRDNPWTWQLKHVRWFLAQHLKDHSHATRYLLSTNCPADLEATGELPATSIVRSNNARLP